MIKIIVAKNDDKTFEEYIKKSISPLLINSKYQIQVIAVSNSANLKSIYSKYNHAITQSNPQDDDILIFVHEDVKILDENLIPKLELIFKKKPEVGLVGIVGTKEYDGIGWWSNDYKHHIGHWVQEYENGSSKHMIRKIGFDDNMLIVDGCFFAVRGKVAREVKFLENLFKNHFHFYDYSYCISVLEAGWKVAVADISILHRSEGQLPQGWHDARKIFLEYLSSKEYSIPLTKEQIKRG